MNRAALQRAGLTLRVLPPRQGCRIFPIPQDYDTTLSAIQKLRGTVYVADGALSTSALDVEGRHISEDDEHSYHLVLWNGQIEGCMRIRVYEQPPEASALRVYDLVRRMPEEIIPRYHTALCDFIQQWHARGYLIGEAGGWAVGSNYKGSTISLVLPLADWAFSRMQKLVHLASSTQRNGSADMLRRLGGWRLSLGEEELPPFYDSAYQCQMELQGFCADILNPQFEPAVEDLKLLLESQASK